MLLSLLEAAERDGPGTAGAADPLLFGLFIVIDFSLWFAPEYQQ